MGSVRASLPGDCQFAITVYQPNDDDRIAAVTSALRAALDLRVIDEAGRMRCRQTLQLTAPDLRSRGTCEQRGSFACHLA
jgi:hypothetical protein